VFRFGAGAKKRGFVAVIRNKPCTQISRSADGSAPRTAATTAHASRGWLSAIAGWRHGGLFSSR
jgi:hypothetical protein